VRKVGLLALMLALVVGSLYMVAQQRADVTVTREQIASNPVNRFTVGHNFAGVAIVVHGFASNKEMMGSWGYTLARQGFDTYVIDQPGHGESTSRLPVEPSTALGDNLRAIMDQLVADGRAKPGRIALVGHSMGGSAVTMAAMVDNRVGATITLSSAYLKAMPVDKPVNILSLAAQSDPDNMVKAVQAIALQSNNGNGAVGQWGSATGRLPWGLRASPAW
jgi:alpha-beta hydrolase superfamily lysophospholipase